jgi:hypothetical protein
MLQDSRLENQVVIGLENNVTCHHALNAELVVVLRFCIKTII